LFVSELQEDNSPYFVEFGACDGLIYSNSFRLETFFGWKGLLAEPALRYKEPLKRNRRCDIEFRCIWGKSGEKVTFAEQSETEYSFVLGTKSNKHGDKESAMYEVETISLRDALRYHKAPEKISFLSIDTEGSEWNILKNFDFDEYRFSFIAIEHNYSQARESIFSLLTKNGYVRFLGEISEFDDWYLHQTVFEKFVKKFELQESDI
jgi:FkbM family methyltransferase